VSLSGVGMNCTDGSYAPHQWVRRSGMDLDSHHGHAELETGAGGKSGARSQETKKRVPPGKCDERRSMPTSSMLVAEAKQSRRWRCHPRGLLALVEDAVPAVGVKPE